MSLQYVHNYQIRAYVYFLALLPCIFARTLGKSADNSANIFGMKTLTAKQEARLQKKKNKMVALAEIIKLNDKDRQNKKNRASPGGSVSSKSEDADTTDKARRRKVCAEEPQNKRMKIESIGDILSSEVEIEAKTTKKSDGIHGKTQSPPTEGQGPEESATVCNELGSDNIQLTEEQYVQLKRDLNQRKRSLRNMPKLRLKEQGEQASLSLDVESRTPIFLTDIQHLLMVALIGNGAPCTPGRWCQLDKSSRLSHTLVLVVEGLSLFHFLSYESNFTESNRIFEHKLEVIMPPHKEGNIIEELAAVPLTDSEKEELIKEYGSLEIAVESRKDPTLLIKTMFPVENVEDVENQEEVQVDETLPSSDKFPRTKLLLSALQMVSEGYPLPLRGKLATQCDHYVFTKDVYAEVTPRSPLFGLDCEMCKTKFTLSELTRISVVDEDMNAVYETLVLPTNKIIDYLTPYSGITAEMMINVTKTLKEVQDDIRRILPPDAILVGQSLNSDLIAMRMFHPYVIDTSVIFNLSGERKIKAKLATLSKHFLGEEIQQNTEGHDPLEDSLASLKLTKLKLSKGLEFGDAVLENRRKGNAAGVVSHNLLAHLDKDARRTAIVTSEEMNVDFQKLLKNKVNVYVGNDAASESEVSAPSESRSAIDCFRVEGNKAAVRKTREIVANYALTITNMSVAPQRLELSRIDKTISNVDKWISRLWEAVAPNGLFIVLLGGAPGASSGVAMLKIKKGDADTVADLPHAV